MLANFFYQDRSKEAPILELDADALMEVIAGGKPLENFHYTSPSWPKNLRIPKGTKFKNARFSHAVFRRYTFKDCQFEDCLFIGSQFRNVEFHKCKFINCNFYKADFQRCYFDPRSIHLDISYMKTASNVGVHVYQALYNNAASMHQSEHARLADIQFLRWKRAQLDYDVKEGELSKRVAKWLRIKSHAYEFTSNFGYSPYRFFLTTLCLFLLISCMNFIALGCGLVSGGASVKLDWSGFVDSIFYTFSVLTILGFSTVTPNTGSAKILTVLEALGAVGWLAIFTTHFVKRYTR